MDKYTIKKYEKTDSKIWNDFIDQAKNATFLFHRDFMEYHQDRFEDFSLLVYENEKLVAVLPANIVDSTVYSHQGLTYGGLVLLPTSKLYNTITIFQSILKYLSKEDVTIFYLKQIPSIYCEYSSSELDYLMYVCKSKIAMKHNISVIDFGRKILISKSRKECIRRGHKLGLFI
ncbi:MAG: GNAT family N-acetyltransferase, partial [Flavobacterium sp.]